MHLRTDISLRRSLASLLLGSLLICAWPACAQATAVEPLFIIERSKNANIVRYDARVDGDGHLDRKKPVEAYWLRLAEDGRRQELNFVERRMAYGFDARVLPSGSAIMQMSAGIGRRIRICEVEGSYRALTRIGESTAAIERIYVKSVESGKLPRVEYIELYGVDLDTRQERYERIIP